MSSKNNENHFEMHFDDKNVWKEFKEEIKELFKPLGIKYQYSLESPTFHILYESPSIEVKIYWLKDGKLTLNLNVKKQLNKDDISLISEIYDMLTLFDGKLVTGKRPEEFI